MKDIKNKMFKKLEQVFNNEYGNGIFGKVMSVLGFGLLLVFVVLGVVLFPFVIQAVERLQYGDSVYTEFFIMMCGTALSWLSGLIFGIRYIKDKTTDLINEISNRMLLFSFVFINVTLIVVDLFVLKTVTGFWSFLFFAFCAFLNLFLMAMWCYGFTIAGMIIVGIILFAIKALLHDKTVYDKKKKISNSSLYKMISSCIKDNLNIVKSVVITESEVKVIFDGKDTDSFVFSEYGFSNLDNMGFTIITQLLQGICKGFKLERLKESRVLANPKFIKKEVVKKVEPKKKEKEVKEEREDW